MARKPCCSKEGLKRGVWTSQEDKLLSDYIAAHGIGRWRTLPANAGLNRCGKSCRLRWLNYLRPNIKRGNITEEEEELILRLHRLLGNRWSLIAGRLPGRTDNEIKNYWNTYLRRKVSASVCKSKQSKTTKNAPSPEKPNPDESSAAVSVIRAKATRCTRSLLFGNTASADEDDTPPPPGTSIDEQHLMRELVGNIVPDRPISKASSYAAATTASCCGGVGATDVSFGEEEDRCVGDWYLNCGILKEAEGEEGMGMCSFLDPDTYNWDSLTLGHKFQTS